MPDEGTLNNARLGAINAQSEQILDEIAGLRSGLVGLTIMVALVSTAIYLLSKQVTSIEGMLP